MSAGQRALHIPPSASGGDINQSAPQTLSSVIPVDLKWQILMMSVVHSASNLVFRSLYSVGGSECICAAICSYRGVKSTACVFIGFTLPLKCFLILIVGGIVCLFKRLPPLSLLDVYKATASSRLA